MAVKPMPRRRNEVVVHTVLPVLAIVGSIVFGFSRYGGNLNLLFTPAMMAVALLLLIRQPLSYLSFVMWVWMLTPLIRRITDFRSDFHLTSLVMVAPLAVTLLSVVSLLRYRRRLDGRALLPYALIVAVLIYGFFIGAPRTGLPAAVLGMANWIAPIVFAAHILVTPEAPVDKARAMLRALVMGGLVIGIYGIVQYVLMPEWDVFWMVSAQLDSIGAPLPYSVRVFGPLNSPGPFAQFVGAASLAALATRSRLRWATVVVAVVALLLTLVRAAWLAWLVGFLVMVYWAPWRQKGRYFTAAVAATVLIVPLLVVTPLGAGVLARMASFEDASNDVSFTDRKDLYGFFYQMVETSPGGYGIGVTGAASAQLSGEDLNLAGSVQLIDSGFVEIFFSFGLLGSVMLVGIALAVGQALPDPRNPLAVASMVVVISVLPVMFFGNVFVGATGMLIYPFAALARSFTLADLPSQFRRTRAVAVAASP